MTFHLFFDTIKLDLANQFYIYDAYDESDDTEENAKGNFLKGVRR